VLCNSRAYNLWAARPDRKIVALTGGEKYGSKEESKKEEVTLAVP